MTTAESLKSVLGRTFAESIDVRVVPFGLAVSTPFRDGSGDPFTFYVKDAGDGYQLEDDGDFLPHLVASGIDIERGQRKQLLDGILSSAGAYADPETLEIRSDGVSDIASGAISFLSALMRIRDVGLLTKDVVRSTFREDAASAMEETLGDRFEIEKNGVVGPQFAEIPADIVLEPKGLGRRVGVFLVNNPTPFVEAELLHYELEKEGFHKSYASAALLEDWNKVPAVGVKRYQRAVNRGLPTAFFRGDEKAAMESLARISGMAA